MKETDSLPPLEVMREAINLALAAYKKKLDSHGMIGFADPVKLQTIYDEQSCLITGLIWALRRKSLPWIHEQYKILQAEMESLYVLGCTCGLGSVVLDASAHVAKDCQGIGQMIRQDVIAERRQGGGLAYFEIKTTGQGRDMFAEQWETTPQLSMGTFGILERYGKEITETFVLGLNKGYREKIKDAEGNVTGRRQNSAFCYGFCQPGNPPLAQDDWKWAYEWIDEAGNTKRAPRSYQKRGVWELETSDWPTYHQFKSTNPGSTSAEFWAFSLPESVVGKCVYEVGPMNRQDAQIAALKIEIPAEERKWQGILWQLYELQAQGFAWASPEFQQRLSELVPRSWACRRYGAEYECAMKGICFHETGHEDPLASGRYVHRRPHHEPELLQAVARGLLPELAEEMDEQED
jgi:hypothetical protein